MTEVALAIDIGGTKTAAAFVGRDHTVTHRASAPTPGGSGPVAIIDTVMHLVDELLLQHPQAHILTAGVGTAGTVDVARGTIIWATETLAHWAGTPVASAVAGALVDRIGAQVPVHVQNDVAAHALGELRRGAAAGADSALVVAVGTGIGAAVIADGRVVTGHRHVAGAFAHVPVPGASHLRCTCGRPGHLEAIGSGLGMLAHYRSLGGHTATNARDVTASAAHDPRAATALRDSAAAVGRAIAGAVTLLDPATVVLSGGVVDAGDTWWSTMEQVLRSELIEALHAVPVVRGTLGADAPLHGAAAAAWDQLGGAVTAPEHRGPSEAAQDQRGGATR